MAADSADARRRSTIASTIGMAKEKPTVDITLSNPQEGSFVPSFTTLEKIEGTASMTCPVDMAFDSLHITFQGQVYSVVEKLATNAPTNPKRSAFHTFLRLLQPIQDEDLPEANVAKAGVTYTFPFTFVVPESLLPQACTHMTENSAVTASHLALPPSLGDPMMAGDGKSLLEDMAPEDTRVSYCIRVFAMKKVEGQSKPKLFFDNQKKIRIIPAVPEAPPLSIPEHNQSDYVDSNTRSIKKGLFKGKLGSLTMDAAQPTAFFLPYPGSDDHCPISTMATINLCFDPTELSSVPPKLGTLICRLKIATFHGATPYEVIPAKTSSYQFDTNKSVYVDTIPLSSRCVESVEWTKHEASERTSRCKRSSSTDSMSDEAEKSRRKAKKDPVDPETLPFYTASVLMPITLPTKKTFVPTFHSCLVSRIYLLDIVMSVRTSSSPTSISMGKSSNLNLKIPVQVAAHGNPNARPVISAEEQASISRREADGYFVPRTLSHPLPEADEQFAPSALARGARGSVYTPRWGSLAVPQHEERERLDESEEEYAGAATLPPAYSGYVRSGVVMG